MPADGGGAASGLHRRLTREQIVTSWLWFVSSYAPLWAMLALRFDPWWLRILLAVLAMVGFAVVAVKLRSRGGRPTDTTLTIVGDAGSEVSSYLAAYLLPFLTVADPDARDLAAYALFILVAGVIFDLHALLNGVHQPDRVRRGVATDARLDSRCLRPDQGGLHPHPPRPPYRPDAAG
ncbi:MAG: hypothetical protein MSC31_18830 [Solirubrobacteraceae bacterium MAG38_C4-C5]|nr:hypothetical protein [Candidatus Siliceabacter maunaloa]